MDTLTLFFIAEILLFIALVIIYMCKHILTWKRAIYTAAFTTLSVLTCILLSFVYDVTGIFQQFRPSYAMRNIGESIVAFAVSLFIFALTFILFLISTKLKLITVSAKENLCLSALSGSSLPFVLWFFLWIAYEFLGAR